MSVKDRLEEIVVQPVYDTGEYTYEMTGFQKEETMRFFIKELKYYGVYFYNMFTQHPNELFTGAIKFNISEEDIKAIHGFDIILERIRVRIYKPVIITVKEEIVINL